MMRKVVGINKILMFILGIAALFAGAFAPMAVGLRIVVVVVAAFVLW